MSQLQMILQYVVKIMPITIIQRLDVVRNISRISPNPSVIFAV
jgi:hypothetical protein